MAILTYLDVLNQITGRLNRDDLTQTARDFSAQQVLFYQREHFYTGQVSNESISTVVGQPNYTFPTGWQDVHSIQLLNGSTWIPLARFDYKYINQIDLLEPSIQSLPAMWAQLGEQFRLFPVPSAIHLLKLWMMIPPDLPADTASNFWTIEAQTLTIEGTIAEICASYLNDPVREAKHREIENREITSISSKTIRLQGGIQCRPYL